MDLYPLTKPHGRSYWIIQPENESGIERLRAKYRVGFFEEKAKSEAALQILKKGQPLGTAHYATRIYHVADHPQYGYMLVVISTKVLDDEWEFSSIVAACPGDVALTEFERDIEEAQKSGDW